MRRANSLFIWASLLVFASVADALDVSGTIYTSRWTKPNSPYHVIGAATVGIGEVLTIDPGVDVYFDADVPFVIEGALFALGEEGDTVSFAAGFAGQWGGLRFVGGDSSSLAYVRITGGNADAGGGISVEGVEGLRTRLTLSHALVSGNHARDGSGIHVSLATVSLTNCTIADNASSGTSSGSGGMSIASSTVTLTGCTITGNICSHGYGGSGGGVNAVSSTVTLAGCTISGNSVSSWGWGPGAVGGGVYAASCALVMSNCSVTDNGAGGWGSAGGGLFLDGSTTATLTNCIIARNTTNGGPGGGMYVNSGAADLVNCTVAHNTSGANSGGAICVNSGTATLLNAIVWGNTLQPFAGPSVTATYSDIHQASGVYPGDGNMNSLPRFVDVAAGDYHLQSGSPCVDAGYPDSPLDPDGSRADMGALPFDHGAPPPPPPQSLILPMVAVAPGMTVTVPVVGTLYRAHSVDLAFTADTEVVVPDSAFIRHHLFEHQAAPLADWNVKGDTILISLSADALTPVSITNGVVVELAFRAKDVPAGTTIPFEWLAYPRTNVDEGSVPLVTGLYGDVSGDGTIAAYDAALILQFVVGRLMSLDLTLADVTGNGLVSSFDAAWVLYKTLYPGALFPIEGGALPKLAVFRPRTLSWRRDGASWALVIDDPTGIQAGEMALRLPGDAVVRVRAGDMSAYRQEGSSLRVAFARPTADAPVLLRLDTDGPMLEAPAILDVQFNEGAIPVANALWPAALSMAQNNPNPFNPSTSIRFTLPGTGHATLAVYAANGQLVRTLVDGAMEAGQQEVVWDGSDALGRPVASGAYLYRLTTEQGVLVRKMVLLR